MLQSIGGETERIQQATSDRARSRALLAGCIGNLVEWYDFALYGAFAAVISATVFSAFDPLSGLLAAFAVFGVAFIARPVGALWFAHVGDRSGRRTALATSILLMSAATAGIGILPGFDRVGWAAPVLLVVLRAVQGVAVGGEYGGSAALVVEYAPAGQRGRYGGWQYATVGFGLAMGIGSAAVVGAVMTDDAVRDWGWRVPFLAALPLGLVGLYVRTRLEETPSFRATERTGAASRRPLVDAWRTRRQSVYVGFAIVAAVAATFNVFYVFLPAFLTGQLRVASREAFGAAFLGLLIGSAVAPAFGRLSDRVGRRPILIGGVVALTALVVPAYSLVVRGDAVAMLVGYLLVGVPLGSLALTAFLAELFPTPLRYSGLSLTYGLASAVFGGSAPLVAVALVDGTGLIRAPGWYVAGAMVVALLAAAKAPETAARPLDPDG